MMHLIEDKYDKLVEPESINREDPIWEDYQEGDQIYRHNSCRALSGSIGLKLVRNGKVIRFYLRVMS